LTHKIYVDATRPATLNDGAGVQTDCPTLGEAVTAWQRLPPEQKIRATIKMIGGPVYTRRTRSTGYISARSRLDAPPLPAAMDDRGLLSIFENISVFLKAPQVRLQKVKHSLDIPRIVWVDNLGLRYCHTPISNGRALPLNGPTDFETFGIYRAFFCCHDNFTFKTSCTELGCV